MELILSLTGTLPTETVASDYIVRTGQTVSGKKIRTPSTLVVEPGATIHNCQIECFGSAARDGALVAGRMINCDLFGAALALGGHAALVPLSGARIWESKIRSSRGHGVLVESAADVELYGLFVSHAALDGVAVRSSQAVSLASCLIYEAVGSGDYGYRVDSDSSGFLVRSRSRYNGQEVDVAAPLSQFGMSACVGAPLQNAMCAPGKYGAVSQCWTVVPVNAGGGCPSYQNGYGDFETIAEALASPMVQDGDLIVVDFKEAWGDVQVDRPMTLLSATSGGCHGGQPTSGAMQGTYGYQIDLGNLTVTAPGVRVIGFHVAGEITAQDDTVIVDIVK